MTPRPLSLQLYTVRALTKTPADFRRVVEQLSEIGYAGIETGGTSDMKPPEFQRWLDGLGMRVSSYWAAPTPENVGAIVDTARVLGVKQIVGGWGADKFKSLDEVRKTAAHFEAAAQLLAPHGLEMCYHNHWWEFAQVSDDAGRSRYGWEVLMELAPTLKAEIDIYWASNFGQVDVPSLVRRYAKRVPLLHVKDGPLVKDQPHTAVGQGKLDVVACLTATDPDVAQWFVVELDEYVHGNDRVMDAVRESYAYLTERGLASGKK